TPAAIGQQLNAAFVLTGSLRRAGARLRINAQLVDTHTDFPVWSERYDREMKDVFEVQDEIARKIADALRVTLSPQEEAALARKPTADSNAYDLYLRGKSYARRVARKDLEFALQMLENAVVIDPDFALAHATIATVCAKYHYHYDRGGKWIDRAREAARRAAQLRPDLPEAQVAEGWILLAEAKYAEAVDIARAVIERNPDTESVYYLLGRTLFTSGRYHEAAAIAEDAIKAAGDDYNIYIPLIMAAGALGKEEAMRNLRVRQAEVIERHLKEIPEDGRARSLLSSNYAAMGRVEDAMREAHVAVAMRPDDTIVLYNVACAYSQLGKKREAVDALRRALERGAIDSAWIRRDPELEVLHGDPEFERLFPA
ncbi:MAG TPA: tetratricopeptide repeat protein, partial [Thermoanaerobaculia bacterium]|nr:tetratricopeptide repeat protein [Thermoanaerobaculia bacterium]